MEIHLMLKSMKLKAAVAAVAFALAAPAHAITTGNGAGVWSDVVFMAWDSAAGTGFAMDLGTAGSSFLPNTQGGDKTPEAGLNLTFSLGNTAWTTFQNNSTLSNIRWDVFA